MRILTRYLLRDLIVTLAFSLTIFSLLFLLASTFRFLREDVPLFQMIEVFPYVIPVTLPYTVPVSLLLAVAMVYGRMAADNELVAIRTSGMHLGWLFVPPLLLGLALSVTNFYFQSDVIPRCHLRQRELLRETVWAILKSVPKGSSFSRRFGPVYFHADEFNGSRYRGVEIEKVEDGRFVKITAKEARIQKPPEGNDRVIVDVYDASLAVYYQAGGSPLEQQSLQHSRESIPLFGQGEGVRDLSTARLLESRWYVEAGLKEKSEALAVDPANAGVRAERDWFRQRLAEMDVEWHQRLVLALAPLVFLLVGLPLPVLLNHSNRLVPFGAAFGLVLILFFVPHFFGAKLGEDGTLPAWLGSWSPLAVLALPGGWLLARAFSA